MNKIDELVDLVDADGVIKKRGIPRSTTDSFPDLYLQIVIGVVLDSEGRVLVHKRSKSKRVNPGDVDHICGAVMTGETPEVATYREAMEETGIKPVNLRIVSQGVNKYKRYRYLLIGKSNDKPGQVDPAEVEWVRFIHPDQLRSQFSSGELNFVDEFFEDTELVLSKIDNKNYTLE